MPSQSSSRNLDLSLLGVILGLIPIAIVSSSFPVPDLPDAGGANPYLFLAPILPGLAGVVLGYVLAARLVVPRFDAATGRVVTVLLELATVAVLVSLPLLYGYMLSPGYFSDVALGWYRVALATGGVLVAAQQSVSLVRARLASGV